MGPGLRCRGCLMRILRERCGGCSQRTKLTRLGVADLPLCCRSKVFALHEHSRDAGLTWKSERNGAWGWWKNAQGVGGHVFARVELMNTVVECGPAGKGVSPPTPGQCLLALRFHLGRQAADLVTGPLETEAEKYRPTSGASGSFLKLISQRICKSRDISTRGL